MFSTNFCTYYNFYTSHLPSSCCSAFCSNPLEARWEKLTVVVVVFCVRKSLYFVLSFL